MQSNSSLPHGIHAHSQGGPHPSNQGSHPAFPLSKLKKEKEEEEKLRHQLEIAKTMVMDLPQPRSPAQSMIRHTPSPRPSPGGHGKSSLIRSKKVSSASPSDREGHYPCNRCGRWVRGSSIPPLFQCPHSYSTVPISSFLLSIITSFFLGFSPKSKVVLLIWNLTLWSQCKQATYHY